MLTSRSVEIAELDDFVELIIALGVAQSIKRTVPPTVHGYVQTIEGVQQALRGTNLCVEVLNLCFFSAAYWRRRHAAKPFALLIANNQPTLIIGRDRNPRTQFAFGNRE